MAMKLVCPILINGVDTTKVLTTVTGTEATFVKNKPGVGKPFLIFATLTGSVAAADFEGAPVVSAVTADNQAAIDAMLADPPLSRLTFA
jgi:hypothetical protein